MNKDKWLDSFRDPEAEYRPHPFWSWNDDLKIDELKWQIGEMKKTGHGGFFMHARDGLITPYMGEDWFDCIRACAEESREVGLNAWCYDENGWPSGSAGGIVTDMGEKYQVHLVRLLEYSGEIRGRVISFYAVKDNSYRRLREEDAEIAVSHLEQGERLMYAAELIRDDYIDLLNPEVVGAFIESTYERYKVESKGELCGGALHGFFTDEPQYALCVTPWSTIVESEFYSTYGYDIADHIPALFLGRDGYEDIRFDFWRMISKLYTESFAKQIYEWCEANSCGFTGHAMIEENMVAQMHCTAGVMPMYEYMSIPGIDYLSRYPAITKVGKGGDPTLALQVGSVAAQLGKKHVITETYALSGWDISFAEMRHLAEWQFLGGVNLMCQHLEGYSLRGVRKNDYPPSMFYQSPWWSEYKALNDTLSREGKFLAEGVNDPGVLMLHPMHSLWIKYTNDDMNAEQEFDYEFKKASIMLSEAHVPYHYGDETIMARHGSVEGSRLKIGKCTYSVVVMPSMFGLDRSTYELLCEFVENGGVVVTLGTLPEFINGRRAEDELQDLFAKCRKVKLEKEALALCLTELGVKKITVAGAKGEEEFVHVATREYPEADRRLYFFVNFDKTAAHRVKITLPEENVGKLLCDSMELRLPNVVYRDGMAVIDTVFEPCESHFFLAGADVSCETEEVTGQYTQLDLTDANAEWEVGEDSDPNCCLLDYCHLGSDLVPWSEENYVWNASKGIDDPQYSGGAMPRVMFPFDISPEANLSAMADVRFTTEIRLPSSVYVNGTKVEPLPGEWFLDRQFVTYSVGDYLVHGKNEIVVTDFCDEVDVDGKKVYRSRGEFGYSYLTGNFGVFFDKPYTECENRAYSNAGRYHLADRPISIVGGNIVPQGFPFFAGRMVLRRKINAVRTALPAFAKLERPYAACARIHVNGEPGELLAWGSFREEITSRLRDGENTFAVEFTVGNRNLLGPHHDSTTEKESVGPSEFSPWTPSTWRRRYCFVKAGLGE